MALARAILDETADLSGLMAEMGLKAAKKPTKQPLPPKQIQEPDELESNHSNVEHWPHPHSDKDVKFSDRERIGLMLIAAMRYEGKQSTRTLVNSITEVCDLVQMLAQTTPTV